MADSAASIVDVFPLVLRILTSTAVKNHQGAMANLKRRLEA